MAQLHQGVGPLRACRGSGRARRDPKAHAKVFRYVSRAIHGTIARSRARVPPLGGLGAKPFDTLPRRAEAATPAQAAMPRLFGRQMLRLLGRQCAYPPHSPHLPGRGAWERGRSVAPARRRLFPRGTGVEDGPQGILAKHLQGTREAGSLSLAGQVPQAPLNNVE